MIGIDIFNVKDSAGESWTFLNTFCQGTSYQVCALLGETHGNPTGRVVLEALNNSWISWARYPERGIVTDRAKYFLAELAEDLAGHGCQVEPAASASPWQLGQVERHGAIWKQTFKRAAWSQQVVGLQEVQALTAATNQSRRDGLPSIFDDGRQRWCRNGLVVVVNLWVKLQVVLVALQVKVRKSMWVNRNVGRRRWQSRLRHRKSRRSGCCRTLASTSSPLFLLRTEELTRLPRSPGVPFTGCSLVRTTPRAKSPDQTAGEVLPELSARTAATPFGYPTGKPFGSQSRAPGQGARRGSEPVAGSWERGRSS